MNELLLGGVDVNTHDRVPLAIQKLAAAFVSFPSHHEHYLFAFQEIDVSGCSKDDCRSDAIQIIPWELTQQIPGKMRDLYERSCRRFLAVRIQCHRLTVATPNNQNQQQLFRTKASRILVLVCDPYVFSYSFNENVMGYSLHLRPWASLPTIPARFTAASAFAVEKGGNGRQRAGSVTSRFLVLSSLVLWGDLTLSRRAIEEKTGQPEASPQTPRTPTGGCRGLMCAEGEIHFSFPFVRIWINACVRAGMVFAESHL